ncbi:hypothetical protein EV421DRAFT_1909071 [Armillaria borealis]|uniref:Uncharacterized protein n=1 Tax=Armillaria borealis TaxID=47425 RepID=A0AA39J3F2_9AGAR|nr:hypothetical protein EV421DRAFT_1909071 [Armillaria borealis]
MTDSLDTAPGHPPSVMTPPVPTLPHSPEVSPPLLTYDELLQQVTILRQRKSLHDSSRATTKSSKPSLMTEPLPSSTSAQVAHNWRQQTASHAETNAINEVEAEAYRQHPLRFELIWLEQYREYRAHQIEQGLPGVSITMWMAQ